MALSGLLLLAVACSDESAPKFLEGSNTEDPQATIDAASRLPQSEPPTPTAVSPSDLETARDFSQGYQTITSDLNQLHQRFDAWQAGLNPCTQSAVQTDLRQFAGRFASVTQAARELTRSTASRHLSDTLIAVAEAEEQALRQLRDDWQPLEMDSSPDGSIGSEPTNGEESSEANGSHGSEASHPGSLADQVDAARSSSSAVLREVSDILTDIEEQRSAPGLEMLDAFVLAFEDANASWDEYHQAYDTFRTEEAGLTSREVVTGLSDLVSTFGGVMVAVRELPRVDSTREVSGLMAEAADAEDLALRQLRATYRASDEPELAEPASAVLDPEAAVDDANGDSAAGSFVASDPSLFGSYETQVVSSNTIRRQAFDAMDQISRTLSEENQAGLAAFDSEYQTLLGDWSDFHRDYDEWKITEGGCDRGDAVETLAAFGVDMGQIAANSQNLQTTNVLRPLGELLVEAIQREQASLRELTDSWQPFDSQVYRAHHDQRLASGRLTRQVGVGIQDLLARYGID